ncbi:hypothetical protein HXY33_01595 [Candidatus Bathyarchaeota archaeon]|nr:hypothetical protein [Candidatus Bathyarchaeota archaeon]
MQKLQVGMVLIVAVTVIVVSVLASTLLMASQRIPNSGDVKAVGVCVYWDSGCTNNVTSIDWAFIEPGKNTNVTVYIANKGTLPLKLNMTTEDWNPASASSKIFLTWNRENYVLNAGSVVQTVLTLSASSDISGIATFSFDILITGTEYA